MMLSTLISAYGGAMQAQGALAVKHQAESVSALRVKYRRTYSRKARQADKFRLAIKGRFSQLEQELEEERDAAAAYIYCLESERGGVA